MKKISWIFLIVFLASLNIGSAVVLFSSGRYWVQSRFLKRGPQLLSIVHGDLMNDGSSVKVVKIKTAEGIVLEFYSNAENGTRHLITRSIIPNTRDGFFDHRGQAVQLAVVDLDGDGKMELLSPTFDANMLARLNPYYYSPEQETFVPLFFSGSR